MIRKLAALMFSFALVAVWVPSALADTAHQDQEMIMTVKNAPLEVPGRVLSPGKYEIRLVSWRQSTVEISNVKNDRPVGFFEVTPDWRFHPTDHVQLNVSEATPGSISRLTGFFYPNRAVGYELEYPQPVVTRTASATSATHVLVR